MGLLLYAFSTGPYSCIGALPPAGGYRRREMIATLGLYPTMAQSWLSFHKSPYKAHISLLTDELVVQPVRNETPAYAKEY